MHALHNELKREHHAYFETVFAHELSKKPEEFESIAKVSTAILDLISKNREVLIETLAASPHVQTELLSPTMHGRLYLPSEIQPTGEAVLNVIAETLKSNRDLSQLLHIHAFFIHRLYDKCLIKTDGNKDYWVKQIFHHKLFADRRRQKIDNPRENQHPGTITNSALAKQARIPVFTHGSPKDQFVVDKNSEFIQQIQKHNYPIASDVSGHTGSLLLGAMMYGCLDKAQLQEYLVAAFSFLTLARAHTFHEVLVVGQTVGLPFSYEDYATSIPENVRQFSSYRKASTFFPQHLPTTDENRSVLCKTTSLAL